MVDLFMFADRWDGVIAAAVEFVVGEREMRARPLSGGLTGEQAQPPPP